MWKEKTKNGVRYCERYEDPLTGSARRVCISVPRDTASARKEAQRILAEKIQRKIEDTTAPIDAGCSLKELSEMWYAYQKKTQAVGTAERNHRSCATFMKILGGETLADRLTAGYVNKKFLDSGREAGTLNEFLSRLKAMLRWAYRNDLVADVSWLDKLTKYPDRPHREKIREKYLERNELAALLNDIADQEDWYLLTQFMAFSGLRFGEAAALGKDDVDLESLEIHVSKSYDSTNKVLNDAAKNYYSERDVHIQPELLEVCRAINRRMNTRRLACGLGNCKLFFFGEDGGFVRYEAFNKYLKEHSFKVCGKRITPHALRHTHASLLFEAGFSIDEVARRLGHGNSAITKEIYVHVTQELRKKDNDKLDSVKFVCV